MKKEKKGIQVISRATQILRALASNHKGLSLSALSKETGLPKSTVQRLVDALEIEMLVESAGPQGGSKLGPALGQLIYVSHGDMVNIARPHLEKLAAQINETVGLGCIAGNQVMLIERVIAEQELCIMIPIGSTSPPYTTSLGKALFSQMSNDMVRKLIDNKIEPYTHKSIKTIDELCEELNKVRVSGIAFDHEEHCEGVCSIAKVLNTFSGPYGVIITTPVNRFEKKKDIIIEGLKSCISAIEKNVIEKSQRSL